MKAALAILLLSTLPVFGKEGGPYIDVRRDDTVLFQMRRDRIKAVSDGVYMVWLRWLWAEPQEWKSQKETATIRVVHVDCNELRVREYAVLHKNAKGEIFDSEEHEDPPWRSLERDSGAGAAMTRVCEFIPQLMRK